MFSSTFSQLTSLLNPYQWVSNINQDDIEAYQNFDEQRFWQENEDYLYKANLLKATLINEGNKFKLSYFSSEDNAVRICYFKNQSEVDKHIISNQFIDIWEITIENGSTLYWFKDKFDQLQKVLDTKTLDFAYAKDLPGFYYGFVIQDFDRSNHLPVYILKQYNFYWGIKDTKRYYQDALKFFLRDLDQLKLSWKNTKRVIGVSFGTLAITGAYFTYQARTQLKESLVNTNLSNKASMLSTQESNSIVSFPMETQYLSNIDRFQLEYESYNIFQNSTTSILSISVSGVNGIELPLWITTSTKKLIGPIKNYGLYGWDKTINAFKTTEKYIYAMFNTSSKFESRETKPKQVIAAYASDTNMNTVGGFYTLYSSDSGWHRLQYYDAFLIGVDEILWLNEIEAFNNQLYLIRSDYSCIDIFRIDLSAPEWHEHTFRKEGNFAISDLDTKLVKRFVRLTASENIIYILGDNNHLQENGLRAEVLIVDITNLTAPKLLSYYHLSDITLKSYYPLPSIRYFDHYLYLAMNHIGLEILRVNPPEYPLKIGNYFINDTTTTETNITLNSLEVSGHFAYLSMSTYSPKFFSYLVDVSNPSAPIMRKNRINNVGNILSVSNDLICSSDTIQDHEFFECDSVKSGSEYEYVGPSRISDIKIIRNKLRLALESESFGVSEFDIGNSKINIMGNPNKSTSILVEFTATDSLGKFGKARVKLIFTRFPILLRFLSRYYPSLIASTLGLITITAISIFVYRRQKHIIQQRDEALVELLSLPAYTSTHIPADEVTKGDFLGKGSYGNVYKGVLYPDKPIAIKQLPNIKVTKRIIDSLTDEIKIIASLNNSNIARLEGIMVDENNCLCLIMEYANRGSLDDYLKNNKSITREQQIDLALEIALALRYLHSQERPIIHGDIKSANILLHEDNQHLYAKLTDFGLSTLKSNSKGFVGTPAWMAPELFNGQVANEKSDVYSFGVVLWELVSQQSPFSEVINSGVIKSWVLQGIRPEIPDDCPAALVTVINNCWKENPAERPIMKDVVADLKKYKGALVPSNLQQYAGPVLRM